MRYFKFIVSLFLLVCFMKAAFSEEAPEAEVLYISGSPRIIPSGETDYIEAELGMLLSQGDKVKTDKDSSLELGFDDKEENVLKVDPDSYARLTLGEDEKMELLEGRVFAIIANLSEGESFEIRTPTAIAGARGTEWTTTVEDDSTSIEAVDGEPYAKNFLKDGTLSKQETVIRAGYKTRVKRFMSPSRLQKIPQKTLTGLRAVRKNIRNNVQNTRSRRQAIPRTKKRQILKNRFKEKFNRAPASPVKPKTQGDLKKPEPVYKQKQAEGRFRSWLKNKEEKRKSFYPRNLNEAPADEADKEVLLKDSPKVWLGSGEAVKSVEVQKVKYLPEKAEPLVIEEDKASPVYTQPLKKAPQEEDPEDEEAPQNLKVSLQKSDKEDIRENRDKKSLFFPLTK